MARSFYARTGVEFTDNLSENLLAMREEVTPRVRAAVMTVAEEIAQIAHDLANVSAGEVGHARDGGHMRDKIEITLVETPQSVTARIGIDLGNVPYAHHQEFGPRGKPFLRPAVDQARGNAHELMRESLAGTGKSLVRFRRFA